jgi:hypothetical protein
VRFPFNGTVTAEFAVNLNLNLHAPRPSDRPFLKFKVPNFGVFVEREPAEHVLHDLKNLQKICTPKESHVVYFAFINAMVWYGISRPTLSVSAKVACYIHYTVHESLIFGNSVGSLSRISVSSDSEHRCSPTMSPPFLNQTITIWCAVHPLARTDWNTSIFNNVPDEVRIVSFLLYS